MDKTWIIVDSTIDSDFYKDCQQAGISCEDKILELDQLVNKAQYLRLEIVQPYTQTIKSSKPLYIEGLATSGSINVDGKSAVRRTGSLTLAATRTNITNIAGNAEWVEFTDIFDDDGNELGIAAITQLNNLIAIDKEIKVQMGIEDLNFPGKVYAFKLGWFVIKNASLTRNNQGLNIQVSLSDLMSRLNGDVGGTLSTPICHSPNRIAIGKDKNGLTLYDEQPATFKAIIETLVQEFGGLKDHQILCRDFPNKIKNTVHWKGANPIYTWGSNQQFAIGIYPPHGDNTVTEYNAGDSIGYQVTDFVYPDELSSNAGDTIVSVLDKIKNTLGGIYEYYFDVDGNFIFQQVQDHLNEGSQAPNISKALEDKAVAAYLYSAADDSYVKYHFNDATLITSYQNTPKWDSIKNDIAVWGKGGNGSAIWLHLTIGKKYESQRGSWTVYKTTDDGLVTYYKNPIVGATQVTITKSSNTDWRTQLCLDYITEAIAEDDLEAGYGKELASQWPRVFDLENNKWLNNTANINTWANNLSYFFDRIDPNEVGRNDDNIKRKFDEMSIEKIGKRTKVINNDKINSIFAPAFPNYVYVIAGKGDTAENRSYANAEVNSQKANAVIQVSAGLGQAMGLGSTLNPAYDTVRAQLHTLTSYNESISVTVIPIFHLEPNTLIYVHDEESGIEGNYTLNSFSIPFDVSGTMNLSCSKALIRI